MKASGGLVGITLNESALVKFFLIAPEIPRLADEAICMAGLLRKTPGKRQSLSVAIQAHEEKGVQLLTATTENFTNPFLVNNAGFSSYY